MKRPKKLYTKARTTTTSNKEKEYTQKNDNIPNSIEEVREILKSRFSECQDFILREIYVGEEENICILIAFIDELVNKDLVNRDILKPLLSKTDTLRFTQNITNNPTLCVIKDKILNICNIKEMSCFSESIAEILSGNTLIYIDGCNKALNVELKNFDNRRAIVEPPSDVVIRGPREGFTENLFINITLLRRKIKNTNLKFEIIKVGKQTNTDVSICYIKGIANEEIIENLKRKINDIKIDAVLESQYIEELIQSSTFSIFPTVGNTEKPDIVAGKILEGRIAILCDGTPVVLTVPYLFIEAIQSSEDYYFRSPYSIVSRFIRFLALFITSLFPAYYVALVNFHQDIIPFKLLTSMAAAREGIPFSPLVEALIMVISFELLREAGIRMPKAIGHAVSIVGALIIGDAAVKAGLISAPMVIVISITAITSFILPQLSNAFLILRIINMFAANVIGIFGIAFTSIIFFIHMCRLKSFGVNYLFPITPLSSTDLKDIFIRVPIWSMFTRPKQLTWEHQENAKYRSSYYKKRSNK